MSKKSDKSELSASNNDSLVSKFDRGRSLDQLKMSVATQVKPRAFDQQRQERKDRFNQCFQQICEKKNFLKNRQIFIPKLKHARPLKVKVSGVIEKN